MVAAVATTTGGLLPVFLTGALAVQISRDLELDERSLGIAVACFFAASTACTAYFGRLADRVGGARLMRLATVPAFAVLVSIAALVHSWPGLVGALAVAGAANGAIQPAANRYIAGAVHRARQGFAFGVKQAAIPAATLLAGLAVPAVAVTIGWRWAFVLAAFAAALTGLLVSTRAEGAAADPPAGGGGHLAVRPLVILALGMAAGSSAANALGAFFVLSAVHTGVSDSVAGLLAAAGSAASLLVRLGVGYRADRRAGGHLRVVAAMSAAGTAGFALLAVGGTALLLPAAVVAYGAGWGWAGLFNFAVARSHPHAPGRATGLTQVGASGGACVGPLAFGFVAAHAGYPAAWWMAAGLLLLGAALIRTGWRALSAVTR